MFSFIFSNVVFASSSKMREIRAFYDSFKPDITDEMMITAVMGHQKNKDDKKFLDYCIASYICSDDEVRGMLEKELGKNDLAIRVGKDILRGVGKEIPEISSKTETQSKGNGYFTNKEKERREKNQDIKTLDLGSTKS